MSFREVKQHQTVSQRHREITVLTGGTSGGLQDVSVKDASGGYAYRDSSRSGSPLRNRFIYWKTSGEVLELAEQSLDYNLTGNSVQFRFPGAPLLGCVHIQETHGQVIVLVATVSTVHRLIFPHPNKLHKYDQAYMQDTEQSIPSILADVSASRTSDPNNVHCINNSGTGLPYVVHSGAAWLCNNDEALFALATNTGSILLIKMPPHATQGIVGQYELKQASIINRLWTSLASAVRSGTEGQVARSLVIHPLGPDVYIFAVCQDHKLRMWSCRERECVMVADMLEFVHSKIDVNKVVIASEGHMIRKSAGVSNQGLYLGIYLAFSDRRQFCVLQPLQSGGHYQFSHIGTILSSDEELIDFCVTNTRLWTLQRSDEGRLVSYSAPFISNRLRVSQDWQPVFLEQGENEDVTLHPHQDPRDAYISHIFEPGAFSNSVILKALQIYRRSVESKYQNDPNVSVEILKFEVTAAVEHEIRNSTTSYEVDVEEYYQLQRQQWSRFYSFCCQYQDVAAKPLGLFADCNTGLVVLVKKSQISLVRTCHLIEHLYMSPLGSCTTEDVKDPSAILQDEDLCKDILAMNESIKTINQALTEEMEYAFHQDMYHTQSPEVAAQQIVNALFEEYGGDSNWQQDILLEVQSVDNIISATEALIEILDLARAWPDGMFVDDLAREASRQLSCSHLFASSSSVITLASSVRQLASTAFGMSRDLLLLLTLVMRLGHQAKLQLAVSEQIQSELLTRVAGLIQSYFCIMWASNVTPSKVSSAMIERNERQMEAIELLEVSSPVLPRLVGQNVTLLEAFLYGQGGSQTRRLLAQSTLFEEEPTELWEEVWQPTVTVIAQLVWPKNASLAFPEFLAEQSQYLQLQEYVRLTRGWCETNTATREFLLGLAYLNTNEGSKAAHVFMEAVPNITNEEFMLRLLRPDQGNPHHVQVLYYLKVIRLFELFSLPQLVVDLATTAISKAQDDDPDLPTLWSKVFKYELELGHNDKAYKAMVSNPDPSRRKDCLRQLLIILCERGQLEQLVQFSYTDLQNDVVNILETRARSVDLTKHNYYDLLYSFHVYRGNFRKAGSIMYEYGLRLGQEVPGLRGIQQQAKCYLAAMNALRLVDPNYAWILKPSDSHQPMDDDAGGKSPKRTYDGDELLEIDDRQVELVELKELQKEYVLVNARLTLLQQNPDPSHMIGPTSSPEETVTLLISAGLFDVAVSVSQMFDLPLTPVFEGLALKCIWLCQQSSDYMMGDNQVTVTAWNWLSTNEARPINTREVRAADQAWQLLQDYIEKYTDSTTQYHKCVALKLLAHNLSLPSWFVSSYKAFNAAELLRVFLDFDLLEEAALLVIEYIKAVLGKGKEYFGLKTYLRYGAPSVWLPYTSIDQLMIALEDVHNDATYAQLYFSLKEVLHEYFATLEDVNSDALKNSAHSFSKPSQFGSSQDSFQLSKSHFQQPFHFQPMQT